MEDTNTTDLSLNYTHDGNWSYEWDTENSCGDSFDGYVVFFLVCMVICVFGMVGNGIVLWFLGFRMKRNPFTVYILNLAVADCSMLLVYFLLTLAYLNVTIICYDAVEFLCHFFVLSSLGLLTSISTERSVSVIFPIWYRCHRPKHLSGIVSGVLWASISSFMLSIYLCYLFRQRYETLVGSLIIFYSMILSLLMLISNVSMVIRLRFGSQRRSLGKLYVAIVLNVIFFFAFGMPFSVNGILLLLHNDIFFNEEMVLVLALLNSSINPVIYFLVGSWRQRRFQGSIKVALRRVFEEKARSKESPVPEGIPMESTAQGPAGSLGLLTAISTERSVSVIFPIWYRCHRPKHLSGIRRSLGKLYVAVVLNVIFFFAFGMPFSIKAFHDLLYDGFLVAENVTGVLALLNSSINPVIYFLINCVCFG
ncbi:mas-related G-protein coupled receptor member X1-like [Melopsittacus undulatus]|uniref:mas-related G-protein coupled receptor member X1-like n=1 Tax=Melopsittacus undulatus TaxID=13146 RepID=UPI00146AF731|nr:mas-related G-protein coupled receptor member X1-like [Melopsittacus undulatus]